VRGNVERIDYGYENKIAQGRALKLLDAKKAKDELTPMLPMRIKKKRGHQGINAKELVRRFYRYDGVIAATKRVEK
jgi:hypothetical protein